VFHVLLGFQVLGLEREPKIEGWNLEVGRLIDFLAQFT
jgi:hypothetical protein